MVLRIADFAAHVWDCVEALGDDADEVFRQGCADSLILGGLLNWPLFSPLIIVSWGLQIGGLSAAMSIETPSSNLHTSCHCSLIRAQREPCVVCRNMQRCPGGTEICR